MLVLIDESGCSGFKLETGSTKIFVVAMVVFTDFIEAEKTSAAIAELRNKQKVKPEFKFSKSCDNVRDHFFDEITRHNFTVRALVVKKNIIHSRRLVTDSASFYNYFVRSLMSHDGGRLEHARIKIDGSGDKEFRLALDAYLRKQIEPGKIHSIRFADSRRDNLVQLADMCAGAIARSYNSETRGNADRWRAKLRPRIENIWEFK
ncbi:DUF3800 domain-containing protein [Paramagnetospirillum kuznetsovii]|uniref:DUF3800 domain-containing protein n=1 Tax=Paramagnetospirillum kuznetsovii TaxID=2053833 RepID=A0A364P373_9PROT|nr:DUF3800 domain-containing protein [Paramagnetospirillum kuznetsovii]RAU23773.1 DUF3800 domain-containing protein [Paramagnetospirillum kuznetsovii]